MSPGRRLGFALLAVGCMAAVLGVGYWAAQPNYRALYTGLSVEDAGAITAKLQAQGVAFRLAAGGTTVLVPAEQVQQLRVDLAVDGLPGKGGGKGFEIFDGAPLGMTPFMQHVNYGRALQAELAKTIMQLEPVAYARVHIVQPESTPFIRDQKPTTASVVLKLKPGATLNRSVAAGIVALVARSVVGLTPEQVTVLDAAGHVLCDQRAEGQAAGSAQLEAQREVETYLASKAEDMLGRILGPGRAIVRVTAETDFKRRREKKESYDPDQKVVARENVMNSRSTTPGTAGARGPAGAASNLGKPAPAATPAAGGETRESIETEYHVTKVEQELEEGKGTIERLTVAAMVDLTKDEGAPGPAMTLAEAEALIKQAVGFKTGRDEIKVASARFGGSPATTDLDTEWIQNQRWQTYLALARNASLGVAALVALLLGWVFVRRLQPRPPPQPTGEETKPRAFDEVERAAQQDPEAVARLVAAWLQQPQPPRQAAA